MKHAIKAIELNRLFNGKQKTTYLQLIKDKAIEDIEQFLTDELPDVCPTPTEVFVGNECSFNIGEIYFSDFGFDPEQIYVTFEDKDLYEKNPTRALEALTLVGITNDAFGNTLT